MSMFVYVTSALLNAVCASWSVHCERYDIATLNALACIILCGFIAGER